MAEQHPKVFKLPDGSPVKPDAHNSFLDLQQRIAAMRHMDTLAEMAEVLSAEELSRIKNLPTRRAGINHSASPETGAEEAQTGSGVKNEVPVYVSGPTLESAVLDAYIRALAESGQVTVHLLDENDPSF